MFFHAGELVRNKNETPLWSPAVLKRPPLHQTANWKFTASFEWYWLLLKSTRLPFLFYLFIIYICYKGLRNLSAECFSSHCIAVVASCVRLLFTFLYALLDSSSFIEGHRWKHREVNYRVCTSIFRSDTCMSFLN